MAGRRTLCRSIVRHRLFHIITISNFTEYKGVIMADLRELAGMGQSIWLDYISRSLITSGELQGLIDKGLRGITSNPSIFEKAVSSGSDYDDDIRKLAVSGKSVDEIYEALVTGDVRDAADLLRPVYDATDGVDGYVSLEVNPELAHDADGTIIEARHLFATLDRPNVFIKVPATPAGVPAIKTLISEGININVTLIFSVSQYEAISEAYIAGLEKRAEAGGDIGSVASVASLFVSRLDSAVDADLEKLGNSELQGKIAVANARMVYARFLEIFSGARWEKLAGLGARVQRPLWASTSAKNPAYPDTLYVDSLIQAHTVNTLPPTTLEAYLDHGKMTLMTKADMEKSRAHLANLAKLGVKIDAITKKLLDDGVDAFATAFAALVDQIAKKTEKFRTR